MNEIYTRPCLLTQWAETSNIQTFASIPSLLYKSAGDIHGYKTVGICVSLPNYLSTCIVLRRSIKLCAVWRYFFPPPRQLTKGGKWKFSLKKKKGLFQYSCETALRAQGNSRWPNIRDDFGTQWQYDTTVWRQAGRLAGCCFVFKFGKTFSSKSWEGIV